LFHIGAHTDEHPVLSQCERGEVVRQVESNRAWIERICRQQCESIAYPGAKYNGEILRQCRALGFSRGYGVARRRTSDPQLAIPRMGIYASEPDVLGFKVQWADLMWRLRLPVG